MNTRISAMGRLLSLAVILCLIPLGIGDGVASNTASAKNVILLIGDGMGFPQLTFARIDKSDENLSEYSSVELFMDGMEQTGYVSTYQCQCVRNRLGSCCNSYGHRPKDQ
jgi:alkaline phosphatase